jgi:uncharacterized protein
MANHVKGFDRNFAMALAAAILGGILASWIGIPVGYLLGASVATAAVVLTGIHFTLPEPVRLLAFFALGIQAGSGVTPAALEQVALWPLSFIMLFIAIAATILATYLYLVKAEGWDRQTAFFAALPGALTFVLAAARETKADFRAVTIVQTLRLFLIIGLVVPIISVIEGGEPLIASPASPDGALRQFALIAVCGIAGAILGHLSKLPGGMMLGSLLASALLFGTSQVDVRMPAAIANAGLIILGMVIGSRFSGLNSVEIRRLFPTSFYAFFVGTIAATVVALSLNWLSGIALPKIALAFVPGAMEAMTVISFLLGIDPTYVAAHHVMRFLMIALTVPFIAKWLGPGKDRS